MKKLSVIFLAVIMLISLASCAKEKNKEASQFEDTSVICETEKETAAETGEGKKDEPSATEKDEEKETVSEAVTEIKTDSEKEKQTENIPETTSASGKTEKNKSEKVESEETKKTETEKEDTSALSEPPQGGGEDYEGELVGGKKIELPKIPLN